MDLNYDNSGVLFHNDRKEKENQPDFTGNITMNGVKKRLAGWKKASKSDPSKSFISLSVSDFQEQKDTQPQPQTQVSNEDLPF
jgi:uncharacterized protein (DUF736 family)